LSAAAVAATASALRSAGDLPLTRTGVVVGMAAATLENDDAFDRGLREKGARGAAPRKFPPTSPNLPPGQCAIAFGLGGPSLSVGADPAAAIEALLVAHDLVAAGDAEAMVVVAAEDVGDVVRAIFSAAGFPVPETGAAACVLRRADFGVSRTRLSSILREGREAGGAVGGARPGFPSFLEALTRLQEQKA
jgi:3-oxoacyl-(acyl-carrier-protein) synthase